ncbi:glycosyltransferase family 69 protein [Parathielavia appendiculata]|uniref:Glycosyltransferase family 69 protein n=1 Tax=Parathielavia appendiculata TaxID=2587402 RepID=A0AAN6U3U8_9PEZI|nr:glycosyltransferase family 69 protein [Parathielavia appendiculata]
MEKHRSLILVQASLVYVCILYLISKRHQCPSFTPSAHDRSAIIPSPRTIEAQQPEKFRYVDDEQTGTPSRAPPDEYARLAKATSHMACILNPSNPSANRMSCAPINTRYGYLTAGKGLSAPEKKQHFFAWNLRQCVYLLLRLLGSLVGAIRFLGLEHCAVSIVAGNSNDGTLEVLKLREGELKALGVEKLSKLQAMALEPVMGSTAILEGQPTEGEDEIGMTTYFVTPAIPAGLPPTRNAMITFINDVSACAEDIMERIHQRSFQLANMPTAQSRWPPIFYHVWIACSLTGDLLFDISAATGSWERSMTLFFDHPPSQARFNADCPPRFSPAGTAPSPWPRRPL